MYVMKKKSIMISAMRTISSLKKWDVIQNIVKPLEFEIIRDQKAVLMRTNAITYVVKKR